MSVEMVFYCHDTNEIKTYFFSGRTRQTIKACKGFWCKHHYEYLGDL